jgi:hypothetical protein
MWERRYRLSMYSMRSRLRATAAELAKRSAVFRLLFARRRQQSRGAGRAMDSLLLILALLSLTLVLAAAVPALLVLTLLVPIGALFPLLQLALSAHAAAHAATAAHAAHAHAALALPWTLSAVFCMLVLVLLLLLPRVARFQSLRADLTPTAGLPSPFFSPIVVREMVSRYHASREHARTHGAHTELAECCVCLRTIERHTAAALDPCGHVFHRECIATWLRAGRHTCPLCRAHACPADIVCLDAVPTAEP